MFRFLSMIGVLMLSYGPALMACEGCKEPSNVIGDSGVGGISASFSWSVVFMLGMLAFLLSSLVRMMIRSSQQLAAQQAQVGRSAGYGEASIETRFASFAPSSPEVYLRTDARGLRAQLGQSSG
ncbi:MAG TPA: hypothetical protein VK692_05360 [Chthoniobacterales bacterium]|jgi:hypothetical protein|nr:hypothetical protein [Chthoniobacterales bacterium]